MQLTNDTKAAHVFTFLSQEADRYERAGDLRNATIVKRVQHELDPESAARLFDIVAQVSDRAASPAVESVEVVVSPTLCDPWQVSMYELGDNGSVRGWFMGLDGNLARTPWKVSRDYVDQQVNEWREAARRTR